MTITPHVVNGTASLLVTSRLNRTPTERWSGSGKQLKNGSYIS